MFLLGGRQREETVMRGIHQFLAGLSVACLMLALPVICQANTITVNSLNDPGASGICALRDAITAANTEVAVNGCSAGSGNDTIVFSTGLIGTITLASTLPSILNSLTIQGPAANPPAIAVSGALIYQVMVVNSGTTLNLSYLTIENGSAGADGGGIYNQGALSVTNSTFFNNSVNLNGAGGAIANEGGTLTVTNSTFSANSGGGGAGGIYNNNGELTVTNTTFSGNNSGDNPGGGIDNSGTLSTLTVTTSTFANNHSDFGGGISNGGKLTVTNSTFSGNSASVGGGIDNDGTLTMINSTLSDNIAGGTGGGIYNEDTLTVTNSTFVGNSAPEGAGAIAIAIPSLRNGASLKGTILADNTSVNCGGPISDFIDAGYNLSDDDSCGFTQSTSANNVTDAQLNLDPAGLLNNGGPTETIALEPGSIAANAIPVASCQYVNVNPCTNPPTTSTSGPLVCDQRGEPRPGSGESACAIGAFEPQTLTEFSEFDTGLIVFPNQFAAGGSFTLGADAVFNPPTQAVTMTIASASFGPLVVTIPAGHFTLVRGQYKYSGTISGIKYGVTISAPIDGVYEFTFAAFGVDVTGITNPVTVTLQIGGNIGTDDNVAAAIL
jgi:hypothetical protein